VQFSRCHALRQDAASACRPLMISAEKRFVLRGRRRLISGYSPAFFALYSPVERRRVKEDQYIHLMTDEPQLGYDDGLPCPEVGAWSETKYRLVRLYDSLFSTGMKFKWDCRVYIDLYSAAGYSRVRNSSKILSGSPLLALTVADPFDKYIFCERDEQLLAALQIRAKRIAPAADVAYILGDCNEQVDRICGEIPLGSRDNTVLGLCFVDPFDLGIKFETLRKMSARFLDFLCLLALHMDANRNYSRYVSEDSRKIDEFLGTDRWRDAWVEAQRNRIPFPTFLAQQFAAQMQTLGYISLPLYKMKEVRSDDNNIPLYHLALFSRSALAYEFWDDVLKYSTDQISFGF
jgi:three-Cys-motif partner protein